MLAPISWLKDFVDIDCSPETLSEKLVGIGFEVEDIIYQNKQATNVVVCKILSVEKHPNADKLSVCKVDIGTGELQIVTNAKMTVGELVPVSLDGAVLFDGTKIKAGELRGVKSDGMFCGGEELGLTSDDYDGASNNDVLRLKGNYKLGENVFDAIGFNDVILDVSITANRPDCNSVFKLSKEVAVALGTTWRAPDLSYKTVSDKLDIGVSVLDEELCPRYMAAGVNNVKIFPSSPLIKKRLRAVGIRPINNIVDITNYVLTEIGQPMHAFDKRFLEGGEIVVRLSKNGEKITTLDGKENDLGDNVLVICDAKKPVAVAGIMGGEYSGIQDDTTSIVFESARFKRDKIRRTARALNLHSDSQARYEKGIDFSCQELGLHRALNLIYTTGSGDILSGEKDVKIDFEKSKVVNVTVQKLTDILGIEVDKNVAKNIFDTLGLSTVIDGDNLAVTVPEERDDILGANELAEEYIRVLGYGNVKPTLFKYSELIKGEVMPRLAFADKVRYALANLGLYEAVTYSFTTPKAFDMLRFDENDSRRQAIQLKNPLGEALSTMRTTLVHSMLEIVSSNLSKSNKEVLLYEIGNVYVPKELPLKELPDEIPTLCIALCGLSESFFTLKNVIEELLRTLQIENKSVKKIVSYLHDGRSAALICGEEEVGVYGEVHPVVAKTYGMGGQRVYVAEIDLRKLMALANSSVKVHELSRYPSMERDLAVVVSDETVAGDLVEAIKAKNYENLEKIEIFDVFKSDLIGRSKKSIALHFVFTSYEKTLVDATVNDVMKDILSLLEEKFGAKIR
ncbi:MAG: phenylalanine--tRNA ligase subunit beta [Acidaminococcus sp.]|nr:phenylalanine--tRNA ligase subunit beta [Acidaminococcus sp.]